MIDMLQNEEGCEAIMDDIIVFGKSAEEHDENLKRTLQVMKESVLKLNKDKCQIKKDRLTYFGHVLSADGVSLDPRKVEAITQLPPPKNMPELRTVIAMINYLGRLNVHTEPCYSNATNNISDKVR